MVKRKEKENQAQDKIKQLQNKMQFCNAPLSEFGFSNAMLK
jgi:hypothetical protein